MDEHKPVCAKGGNDLQELKAEQPSCYFQHRAAGIFRCEQKSDLVLGLHSHVAEEELEKSADPTSVLQTR